MSNSITRRLPLLLLLSLLIALVAYLSWPSVKATKQQKSRVIAVKTATIAESEFKDVVQAIGTARANEQVLITSKYSDLVDEISFDDGQQVKKGEVLVRLNRQEEVAKVRELEANLAESVAQLNRFQDLLKKKATSKSELDQQDAQTKAISAQLMSARTKLNDLTIKAPFDGILGFREISVGAYIDSGDVITSLDDLSVIKVDFTVPERFLPTIAVGQKITATNVAYQEQVFTGEIATIDSRIDPQTRTLKIRGKIPNPGLKLRPGMLLNITIERHTDMVLQVPESAVIPIEDKHFVFVVSDNKALRKTIRIGRRQPGKVEVLSGLEANDAVVVEGALKLREGMQVAVLEDKQ
ncbi:efflux RND transporter periplasmic adaptor subunit [Thalassomonas haliotis]|uniref:Efflux RND transporter periplasmic adaptor subunit n=1 Tax=Thalassomonas haliotis TaxID=485448 RepID=A0ABY7VI03_9GAMM|nr:efflux RND transporter periplasmic adaptor subunit [Thalassomonas haliotis]WDE13086.1 efflux RND transporter periplasmic adaptor subunit [Thalassomonas haliotis]